MHKTCESVMMNNTQNEHQREAMLKTPAYTTKPNGPITSMSIY